MFGKNKPRAPKPRVPIYKRVDCLGAECPEYNESNCDSRLELLEATGKSGGKNLGPQVDDCNYALYGQVCMANVEQVVVRRITESPNGQASMLELVARSGRTDDQRIVLDTPAEVIKFED